MTLIVRSENLQTVYVVYSAAGQDVKGCCRRVILYSVVPVM